MNVIHHVSKSEEKEEMTNHADSSAEPCWPAHWEFQLHAYTTAGPGGTPTPPRRGAELHQGVAHPYLYWEAH